MNHDDHRQKAKTNKITNILDCGLFACMHDDDG
jgi:hypothetical protein